MYLACHALDSLDFIVAEMRLCSDKNCAESIVFTFVFTRRLRMGGEETKKEK